MEEYLTYFPIITVISKTTNIIAIEWTKPPEELGAHIQLYRISINYTYNGKEMVESKNTTETYYNVRYLHPSTSHNFEVKVYFSDLSTDCYSGDVRRKVFTESIEVESGTQVGIWLPLTGISFLLAILEAWRFYKTALKRRILRERLAYFYTKNPTPFNPELSMNAQADSLPYEKEWEFPQKLLRLDEELGRGLFGIVWKAIAKTIRRPEAISVVAVKTVRPTASLHCMKALLRELKILVYLGHHANIVSLLGACTKNLDYGQLLVIVEFCRFGNLHDYLWRCRSKFVDELGTVSAKIPDPNSDDDPIDVRSRSVSTSSSTNSAPRRVDVILVVEDLATVNNSQLLKLKPPTKYPGDFTNAELDPVRTRDLVSWAWQISRGMQYLAAKKVLHGDLATRNVLLLKDNVVKICDFGLSKSLQEDDQYKVEGNDPLPVKWMAIESLRDGIFSVKSDVWSFGVLLWELFSLAKTPYPEINPQDTCETLVGGYRMERPKYSPETIYRTILQCWEANPSKRPTFVELEHSIGNLMEENVKMESKKERFSINSDFGDPPSVSFIVMVDD
ncbi:vascular endothelial growth factor receptor 1-like [Diprion similis]|uniref:vascular endothelial growth factor receptor 1-like n=1 Tax=Diprion similis TaxID=362088 RepID=UPI001EF8A099|nr:vascular endothelial growth factor receptor 1-like [Diprion similis]